MTCLISADQLDNLTFDILKRSVCFLFPKLVDFCSPFFLFVSFDQPRIGESDCGHSMI